MSKINKIFAVLIIIIVIILIIVSAGKKTDNGPIKIGMVSPLSGNLVALGELMKGVTDIAVDEINSSGGVNGRPISIIYEDDQCLPTKSVSSAQKLIEIDGVKIIIASTCSGSVLSILPVTDKNNVLLVSGSATTPALSNKSNLFARSVANDDTEAIVLANVSIEKEWKKIGVIQENSDYALGLYSAFAKNYTSDKGEIIKEEYPSNTTDFRSILTKIKATDPDALFIDPQSPITAQIILTNLSQLKWNVPITMNHVMSGATELIRTNKEILEGAYAAEQSPDLNNPKYFKLEESYKKAHGVEMNYKAFGEAQYDLIYILRDGLKQFGNDPVKIAEWIRTIKDYDGASGKLTMNSEGNRLGGHVLKMIKDGVATVVTK